MAYQLLAQGVFVLNCLAGHQRDIAVNALSLDRMRVAHDSGFRNRVMRDECRFDFRRTEAMAGNIEHVIDAARDPVITVLIAAAAVTGEILAFVSREISFDEALVITVKRTHLTRPAIDDAEIAVHSALNDCPFAINQFRLDAEERTRCRTRLEVGCTGQWRNQNAAGFRLPPGIDNR